jgi:hypothetical protein
LVALALLVATTTESGRPARTAPVTAYGGLGSWIDVYEEHAWANPRDTVKHLAQHGVKTLYLETGNSTSSGAVFKPVTARLFIAAAHARGMKVVAWYLPDLADLGHDYDRVAAAIALRTPDGQRFDSFALDIESTSVNPESARNAAVDTLSKRIRQLVGASYPLGAIIPSPVGIAKRAGFWDTFPYGQVATDYDAILPMAYYTYHGTGAAAASADAAANVRILRKQPGCADLPVHLIGGLAQKSTSAEVEAFARAAHDAGCIGASLYSYSGTTRADWAALRAVTR